MSNTHWTEEQAVAIQTTRHTLLAASAGTGKTTTVIGKILWHLGIDVSGLPSCPPAQRFPLHRIAAITFTEKAAYDLKRKLRAELVAHAPELLWELDRATIGTIHSFCADVLRDNALRLGIDPSFVVLDERESQLEMYEIIKEILLGRLTDGDEDVRSLAQGRDVLAAPTFGKSIVDHVRSMVRDIRWHPDLYDSWSVDGRLDAERLQVLSDGWGSKDDLIVSATATLTDLAREVIAAWRRFEVEENVRDFDSLILDARDLLTGPTGAPALSALKRRYGLFVIDEFQDTDGAQRDIAFATAGIAAPGGSNSVGGTSTHDRDAHQDTMGPLLFLVGDAKQSIYGFRGADISVWNKTQGVMGPTLSLTQNFRSDEKVVDFVNRTCRPMMSQTGLALDQQGLSSRVDYQLLQPFRRGSQVAEVEWLEVNGAKAKERRVREATMVAARIRDLVIDPDRGDHEGIEIEDPDSGKMRDCSYRDIAVLFRSRTGLEHYEDALRRYGIPYHMAGDAGLKDRLEVLDLITLLRLIDNPRDDVLAFAFLRSPFVGLRDEVIARIRMFYRGGSLLKQAEAFLKEGDWFECPEHGEIASIERRALERGIHVLKDAFSLRTRVPADELLEDALAKTGYLHHMLLLDQHEPKLANIHRFVRLLQGYRHHTVGSFLEIWDRWDGMDLGIPQAPLYSNQDDVVTLSTIHSAKGLEWPVVFLVDVERPFRDNLGGDVWSDRMLGPLLCPKQSDRGPRALALCARKQAEDQAEEGRLLYVAATRARDRLVIAAPTRKPNGQAKWLNLGMADDVRLTGAVPDVEIPPLPPEPSLEWMDNIVVVANADLPLIRPIVARQLRASRSATELMTRRRSRAEWRLKYLHGVVPYWSFVREGNQSGLSATVRGVIVHGVLELIEDEAELAELLDVTIGALDSPEVEERLAVGSEYRRSLEREIRGVVRSADWKWYVDGEHHRETRFVDLRSSVKWRVGAFDLFKPMHDTPSWIIDFKTHEIPADECVAKAKEYSIQAGVYRSAARHLSKEAQVRLHFTRPNTAVDLG